MNTQFTSETRLFQDRPLADLTPRESWHRLTAGDEGAERFEGVLRLGLVISVFATILICGLRLRPSSEPSWSQQLAMPSVNLPQMIQQAPANVAAALPTTMAVSTPQSW